MAEITEFELKDMKLHEEKKLRTGTRILRVVDGWIYWVRRDSTAENNEGTNVSIAVAGVFVPER